MIAIRQRRGRYALDGVNFFVAAMQAGFGVFVTVYLVQNGWAAEAVGLALTLSTVASLASQLPAGALIDRLGDKRRAVQVGVAGVGVAALLLALSAARPGVYLAQALQGLASSLVAPGIAAISLAAVGHAGLCERIGRNARFASIGGGLTAGVMGLAGSYFQPVAIFWLTAVLALPTLLFVSFTGPPRAARRAEVHAASQENESRPSWEGLKRLLHDRRLLAFACCIVLFFAASAALLPGVAARVTRRYPEFATLIVAGTMLLPQAVTAAIAPWVGRKADRAGRRPLLLLGWSLVPLQAVLYATLAGAYALPIGLMLNGVSSAVFGVMMTIVAADLTRGTGRFNLTLGAFGVAIAVGASLSTLLGGLAVAAFGGSAAFLVLALFGLLGILLLWVGFPETKPVARDPAITQSA